MTNEFHYPIFIELTEVLKVVRIISVTTAIEICVSGTFQCRLHTIFRGKHAEEFYGCDKFWEMRFGLLTGLCQGHKIVGTIKLE